MKFVKSYINISGQELAQWRERARQEAIVAHIDLQELDWFLQETTELDKLSLRLNSFIAQPLIKIQSNFDLLWRQRLEKSIPIQYLIGHSHWRNFTLKVTPDVLIPRPETEYIIDLLQDYTTHRPHLQQGNWVDLGTGSGAISLGLTQLFPQGKIYAVDCSVSALAIAQENAQKYHLEQRIKFYHGSWWQPLNFLQKQVTGMISNPPYIPTAEILHLQPEVKNHEPHLALDGGSDGLGAIRHLVKTAPEYLQSGGVWLIEMMAGQGQLVKTLLEDQGEYDDIRIINDFAGFDRFVFAIRR